MYFNSAADAADETYGAFADDGPLQQYREEEEENAQQDSYNHEEANENEDADLYGNEQNGEEDVEDEYQYSEGGDEKNVYGGDGYNNRGYESDDDNGDSNVEGDDDDYEGPAGATYNESGHGPHPDPFDHRDRYYEPTMAPTGSYVDLRETHSLPPVYDQKNMMSCTAHAVAGAFEIEVRKLNGESLFSPSRLFLWYNARAARASSPEYPDPWAVYKNIGSYVRDAIKSLKKEGVCSEEDWPYQTGKFNKNTRIFVKNAKPATRPPRPAWQHAHQHTALGTEYYRLKGKILPHLKECLHEGYPVIFGMRTHGLLSGGRIDCSGRGLAPEIPHNLQKNEARHTLLAVGYIEEEDERVVIVRNSWGESFGENGYFYMPYCYLNLCYDFWTLRLKSYN